MNADRMATDDSARSGNSIGAMFLQLTFPQGEQGCAAGKGLVVKEVEEWLQQVFIASLLQPGAQVLADLVVKLADRGAPEHADVQAFSELPNVQGSHQRVCCVALLAEEALCLQTFELLPSCLSLHVDSDSIYLERHIVASARSAIKSRPNTFCSLFAQMLARGQGTFTLIKMIFL